MCSSGVIIAYMSYIICNIFIFYRQPLQSCNKVFTFSDGRKSTSLYSYKKKRLSKITSTDSSGDTETEYYNKKGLVVKYVSKNDNSTLITTNTYNKKGDLIKSVDNSNGDISTRVYTYKYYKKKYIKEELETVKSSDGSTTVWKTEYTGWKKY